MIEKVKEITKEGIEVKNIGYFLLLLGVLSFFLNLNLTSRMIKINDLACFSQEERNPEICPYKHSIPLENIFFFLLSFSLVFVGVYLSIVFGGITSKEAKKKKQYEDELEYLREDERKVFKILLDKKGIYQSELKELTGFSKVKITRILDKLESKDLIERRRRGLTNFIILK